MVFDAPACKWTDKGCKTLIYALPFLHKSATSVYSLSLSAAESVEGVVFTINDGSRLTVEWIKFSLPPLHLNSVSFSPSLTTSTATLSAPLVHFAPTPSDGNLLGSGSCDIPDCSLSNLSFVGTTMFEIETSGRVRFLLESTSLVTTDLEEGKFVSVKGQFFKQQIQPSLWHPNPTPADIAYFVGEDISMDVGDKWKNNSLVYWLISPSLEIRIGTGENAVDHPNCGSSTFQCTTLDSAFRSAELNEISTLTVLTSISFSSTLLAASPSSAEMREVVFDESGSVEVCNKPRFL
ncbi:hypothetical protein BLNAU_14723 [Blattamonas nauphoetae]|uniref:Uncharacterized protein n=1 Tax=Blattamonas nauphoetae TaxID=2049346 RepID=A0ABQ9XG46_9EUKA|nr:hypothetical protein BLNAU_14723 [Blattamonas nauphoetae]